MGRRMTMDEWRTFAFRGAAGRSGANAAPPGTAEVEDLDLYNRIDAQHSSRALAAGIAPEHVGKALDHYARSLGRGVRKGKLTMDEVDQLTDEQHAQAMASIAKSNPQVARKPAAPKPSPIEQGKTYAPGKHNSVSDAEARAEMRRRRAY